MSPCIIPPLFAGRCINPRDTYCDMKASHFTPIDHGGGCVKTCEHREWYRTCIIGDSSDLCWVVLILYTGKVNIVKLISEISDVEQA